MKKLILLLALAIPLIFAPAAGAVSLFSNGNFLSPGSTGQFTTLYAPDYNSGLTEWDVTAGSVDYIGTYWQQPTGSLSLDMNGWVPGTIQQTFYTAPGQEYLVTFDLSGNFAGGPTTKTLVVTVGAKAQDYTYSQDLTWSLNNMEWTEEYFTFYGSGSTTLIFAGDSNNPTAYGPALADVTLTAIPLPPTVLLLGSGLAGLAGLGWRWGRKTA